jgi:hypothetical protein
MSELLKLSNSELLSQIQSLAAEERKLTTQVLLFFQEVERRKLYASCGYSSLFEFAVGELKYSAGAASRRIHAMRFLTQVPEIKSALEEGSLSISNVSSVQTFLTRERKERGKKYSQKEKTDLIDRMKNKSKKECEKILVQISPNSAIPPESQKALTPEKTELRVVLCTETLEKLERLRGLLAHQNRDGSIAGVIELIAELALEKIDPIRKEERIQKRQIHVQQNKSSPIKPSSSNSKNKAQQELQKSDPESTPPADLVPSGAKSPRAPISASVQRQVWVRSNGRCEYIDSESSKQCDSSYGLQLDHVVPVALGGSSQIENLRMLCMQHNQYEAIQKLGEETMQKYVHHSHSA